MCSSGNQRENKDSVYRWTRNIGSIVIIGIMNQ